MEELKRVLQQINQLHRLGATLEDSVCEVLRKIIAQAEAIEELDRMTNWTWRK